MATILDFQIRPQKKGSYSLEIFERGSSQSLAHSSFDYDISYVTQFEINQLEPDLKDPYGRMERIKEFGKKLYDKLFAGDVQKLWADYKLNSDFLILCLRLAPEAGGLEVLPWETLYDGEEFIAAGAKTGLSRLSLDVQIQDKLPAVPSPLKMLALVSSPLDLKENERLQIENEQQILLQAVNAPSGQGKLLLEFEDEAKLPIIEGSLESGYQILHYSGHGIPPEDGGGLLLEDSQGNKRPTKVAEFLQTLQKAEKDLRLAVISGCQTARTLNIAGFRDIARGLLQHKIPAVIAMQFSISDTAGLLFAENLYPRLIEGQMLDVAVSACRRVLLHTEDVRIQADAFAPVLLLSNSQPLQTKTAEKAKTTDQPRIDFRFYLPLPQLSFGFYGRRREYRVIRDGLLHKNYRAIIVHGIGGIGKTALISHAATRLREYFKGIYAFDCSSAALAPETIFMELQRYLERQGISALGQLLHQSIPPDELATFVAQVLSQLPLLIIFDNFETQLVKDDGERHQIADDNLSVFLKTLIKTTAKGSHFLFTSRYLFDIDAKRIGTIVELPLGDLSRPEALGLMQKLPNLSKTSYEDKIRAFDTFSGHPYALVTLDCHCAYKNIDHILVSTTNVHAELKEFLSLELNYNSISSQSRELLNRIAAFRLPVRVYAAEWLSAKSTKEVVTRKAYRECAPLELKEKYKEDEFVEEFQNEAPENRVPVNIDKPLNDLINWGLVISNNPDGRYIRIGVHSLVRDFCRNKLDPKKWKDYLCEAARYYSHWTVLVKREQKDLLIVAHELEAFELFYEAEEYLSAARVLHRSTDLMLLWGLSHLVEATHRKILKKLNKREAAIIGANLGSALQARGKHEKALAEFEKSRRHFNSIGDLHSLGVVQRYIGETYRHLGKIKKALNECKKAVEISKMAGEKTSIAMSLSELSIVNYLSGNLDAAIEGQKKALQINEELQFLEGMANCLHEIGIISQEQGDFENALKAHLKSLKLFEARGVKSGIARSLHEIGNVHFETGNHAKALENYNKAAKILEDIGEYNNLSQSSHQIGKIYEDQKKYQQALNHYEKAFKIARDTKNRYSEAIVLVQMGHLFVKTGEYQTALLYLCASISILPEISSRPFQGAVSGLKKLRNVWGEEEFDIAWREKMGQDVPDSLKESVKKKTKKKIKKKKATKVPKTKTKKRSKSSKVKKTKTPNKTTKAKREKTKNLDGENQCPNS